MIAARPLSARLSTTRCTSSSQLTRTKYSRTKRKKQQPLHTGSTTFCRGLRGYVSCEIDIYSGNKGAPPQRVPTRTTASVSRASAASTSQQNSWTTFYCRRADRKNTQTSSLEVGEVDDTGGALGRQSSKTHVTDRAARWTKSRRRAPDSERKPTNGHHTWRR